MNTSVQFIFFCSSFDEVIHSYSPADDTDTFSLFSSNTKSLIFMVLSEISEPYKSHWMLGFSLIIHLATGEKVNFVLTHSSFN